MPRTGIDHIGLPRRRFRLDRLPPSHRFETALFALREDHKKRAPDLEKYALKGTRFGRAAKALARRLAGAHTPKTLASSRYMRGLRIRVCGNIWQLVADPLWRETATQVTLFPVGWEIPAKDLLRVDVPRWLKAVRADLYRYGGQSADGWLILFVHGEYDSVRKTYRVHLHGIAAGGMVAVIECLRSSTKYASRRPSDAPHSPQRVHRSRRRLTNLPGPITYCLKSYWTWQYPGESGEIGDRSKRKKRRVPGSRHPQFLLWMDKWKLQEISLLFKLRVTKGGLVVNTPTPNIRVGM